MHCLPHVHGPSAHLPDHRDVACRALGGLEAWGLTVDGIREESAREAANAEAAIEGTAEAAVEAHARSADEACPAGSNPTGSDDEAGEALVTVSRAAAPNSEAMCEFEELLQRVGQLPAKERDATLKQVGAECSARCCPMQCPLLPSAVPGAAQWVLPSAVPGAFTFSGCCPVQCPVLQGSF